MMASTTERGGFPAALHPMQDEPLKSSLALAAGKPPLPVAPPVSSPVFLNPYEEIAVSRNRLPHWQQDGRTFFVTFRLGDSIPKVRLDEWREDRETWLRFHPEPWAPEVEREYIRRFANRLEQWLDELHGSCVLRGGAPQRVLASALAHFEGERHRHHSWVVMPNHVHALFALVEGCTLESLLQSWKGFSAREINRATGSSGPLWQRDYFDRMIRNEEHFWNVARYIRNNPGKARLSPGDYVLFESDLIREVLGPRLGEAAFQPPS